MGLLDPFIPADSQLGGLLRDPNASLALAATLLQGTRGRTLETLGQGLFTANAVHGQTTKAEREARAQEMQQLTASYKILKDEDSRAQVNAALTGQPYQPNPLLAQHEQRLAQLMGAPQLYGQTPPAMPMPQARAGTGASAIDTASPRQANAMPTAGAYGLDTGNPVASPQATNRAPQAGPDSMNPGKQPTLPEMLAGAGIPPGMAQAWAATPEGQRALFKHLADVYGPRTVNNVLMQMHPSGQTKFLGGVVGNDVAPVAAGPGGALSVQPIQGATDYFANRAAANTRATEGAKAEYDLVNVPTANGQTRYMTRSQAIGQTGQAPQSSSPNPAQVAPQVQAQRDQQRLQILYGEREQQRKAGQVDPNLEREIQFAEQGRSFGGPAANGPGFTAGQTTAGKVAAETNPRLQLDYLAKSYDETQRLADGLVYVDAARQAVNGQTTTGLFAKPALLAARVGAAFGITDPKAASDPELFMAMAGRQVMSVIKNLGSGSGISDADREYAAKTVGGDIKLNKDSINRLLDIQERATRRLIELHNGRVEQAGQAGVPSVFDYRIRPPETARTPVANGELVKNTTALIMARQAIKQGKPRDAVVQRLMEQGFSAEGL